MKTNLLPPLFLAACMVLTPAVLRGQEPGNLADTVAPVPDRPGKIAASTVPMRNLSPHPTGPQDPYDSLQAIRDFHVTRLEWTYHLTPAFVKKIKAMGVTVSGATGASLFVPDAADEAGLEKYNILTADGRPTTAPWMRQWNGGPGHWYCVNRPAVRQAFLADLKRQLDMGVQDIQRDDPAANGAAVRWGACFCPDCMAGFRAYLHDQVSPEKLKALGIDDLSTFDYGKYLLSIGAPTGDAFAKYPGGELKDLFVRFQKKSSVDFHEWWHKEINAYAGRYVPISSNNALGRRDFSYAAFDFYIGEFSETDANPQWIYNLGVEVHALGKSQVLLAPRPHSPDVTPEEMRTMRDALATTYATGMVMEVPWDLYLPTPKADRVFTDPKDCADLYALVRGAAPYLDGYELAAATGQPITNGMDSAEPPVRIPVGYPKLCAFTRVKPGAADAPVVVHLVDWSDAPAPFRLSLQPKRIFHGRPYRAMLLSPRPYDKAAHARASATNDYSALVERTDLGSGRLTSLDIPALSPWGILVLEPLSGTVAAPGK